MGCSWVSALLWAPMGCSWVSALTLNSFSPGPSVCRAAAGTSCLLSPSCCFAAGFSLPKYTIPLWALLMGSALASSVSLLEQAGVGSAGHGRSFWHLCTEVCHPCSPPLPKPGHTNLVQVRTSRAQHSTATWNGVCYV